MKKNKPVVLKYLLLLFALQCMASVLVAQAPNTGINPQLLTRPWSAYWIGVPRPNTTTWGEITDPARTRSDSHAWGSSPNIELYRIVLGIDSDAPGFSNVRIEPHLGELKSASGEIPHPNGTIDVNYLLQSTNKWKIEISLPAQTTGYLVWKGKCHELKAGKKALQI